MKCLSVGIKRRRIILSINKVNASNKSTVQQSSKSTKRILIYSHDTVGLGNIRRTLVIANRLVERRSDVTVLILTGSPMLHAFRLSPGIDYVKLPCLDRGQADEYRVKSLSVGFNEVLRLRANLIQQTMTDFKPDLILVDKKPLGVERELAPAFELLALRGQRPKCALLLRDILDHPKQTIRIWKEHRYYEALNAFYDEIFVLGAKEIFDVAAEYRFPRIAAKRVHYCGYLRRAAGHRQIEEIRAQFPKPDRPLVLVTVGGGADGAPLIQRFLDGLRRYEREIPYNSLVITGPELAAPDRERLKTLVKDTSSCHFGEFSDDIMSEMAAADLTVSMGGYNTVCEILSLNKKAIVIPRSMPVHEQLIRARKMSSLGLFEMIEPDDFTTELLMEAVERNLSSNHESSVLDEKIALNGLENLVRQIDRLLDTNETPEVLDFADAVMA